MCVCFERNFLAMGNSLEDFWSINKKYMHIRQYKKVLIVMSKDFLTDLKSLYYMDVLKSLKNKGAVSIMAMIDIDVVLPERYNWINDEDVDRIAFY